MGDYDYLSNDVYEDLDYFDGNDYFDDDLLYDDVHEEYDGSDITVDDYYDETDEVMSEDFEGREGVEDNSGNDATFDPARHGSDDNMSEASDSGCENAAGLIESDDEAHDSSGEGEYFEDYPDDSVDQGSGILDDLLDEVIEEGEIINDNQSNFSGESDLEVFADAQNGNYEDDGLEYANSDDCEEMDDEFGRVTFWEGDFIGGGTWVDTASLSDEWEDYYDGGDEIWDEDAGGRFELQYEDYGGDDIPGEALDAPVRDNFVMHSTTVEAAKSGEKIRDPVTSSDKQNPKDVNNSCPICLEQLDAQEVGSPWNCRHYFCVTCIVEWVRRSNTCPVDRETICKIAVRSKMGSPVTRVVSVMPVREEGEV